MRRVSGYSDAEDENFPEPKPDYSDDDFEIKPKRSPKKSPLKKKRGMNFLKDLKSKLCFYR